MNNRSSLEASLDGNVNSLPSARDIAIRAGDASVLVRKEVIRILKEQRGHRLNAAKVGVDELRNKNLIDAGESKEIKTICDLVFESVKKMNGS